MRSEEHVVIPNFTDLGLGVSRFEVLRYPSLASAQAMYIDQSVIFTCAEDIETRMTMPQMQTLFKFILREKYESVCPLPKSKPVRADLLWDICLKYARPHNPRAKTKGKRAEKRADTRYRVAPLYREFIDQVMPPQMRRMAEYFIENMSPDGVDEEGVEQLVMRMHDEGELVTKQDPVRIWRYYRAQMIKMCLLELI